jgi:hypothetical protein
MTADNPLHTFLRFMTGNILDQLSLGSGRWFNFILYWVLLIGSLSVACVVRSGGQHSRPRDRWRRPRDCRMARPRRCQFQSPWRPDQRKPEIPARFRQAVALNRSEPYRHGVKTIQRALRKLRGLLPNLAAVH